MKDIIKYKDCPICEGVMPMIKFTERMKHSAILCYQERYRCVGCLKVFKEINRPETVLEEVQ